MIALTLLAGRRDYNGAGGHVTVSYTHLDVYKRQALPYIMPRRYDAHDYITEYAELEPMRRYIQSKRREGVRISYVALIRAAYFKAYQQDVYKRQVYERSHASMTKGKPLRASLCCDWREELTSWR